MPSIAAIFFLSWSVFAQPVQDSDFFGFQPELRQFAVYFRSHGSIQYQAKQRIDGVLSDTYRVGQYNILNDGSERLVRTVQEPKASLEKKFITDLSSRCREWKGVLQDITVRAGSFKACKVVFEDNSVHTEDWYAAGVPFGVVKHLDYIRAQPQDVASFELVRTGKEGSLANGE